MVASGTGSFQHVMRSVAELMASVHTSSRAHLDRDIGEGTSLDAHISATLISLAGMPLPSADRTILQRAHNMRQQIEGTYGNLMPEVNDMLEALIGYVEQLADPAGGALPDTRRAFNLGNGLRRLDDFLTAASQERHGPLHPDRLRPLSLVRREFELLSLSFDGPQTSHFARAWAVVRQARQYVMLASLALPAAPVESVNQTLVAALADFDDVVTGPETDGPTRIPDGFVPALLRIQSSLQRGQQVVLGIQEPLRRESVRTTTVVDSAPPRRRRRGQTEDGGPGSARPGDHGVHELAQASSAAETELVDVDGRVSLRLVDQYVAQSTDLLENYPSRNTFASLYYDARNIAQGHANSGRLLAAEGDEAEALSYLDDHVESLQARLEELAVESEAASAVPRSKKFSALSYVELEIDTLAGTVEPGTLCPITRMTLDDPELLPVFFERGKTKVFAHFPALMTFLDDFGAHDPVLGRSTPLAQAQLFRRMPGEGQGPVGARPPAGSEKEAGDLSLESLTLASRSGEG